MTIDFTVLLSQEEADVLCFHTRNDDEMPYTFNKFTDAICAKEIRRLGIECGRELTENEQFKITVELNNEDIQAMRSTVRGVQIAGEIVLNEDGD